MFLFVLFVRIVSLYLNLLIVGLSCVCVTTTVYPFLTMFWCFFVFCLCVFFFSFSCLTAVCVCFTTTVHHVRLFFLVYAFFLSLPYFFYHFISLWVLVNIHFFSKVDARGPRALRKRRSHRPSRHQRLEHPTVRPQALGAVSSRDAERTQGER